ncbi:MAG: hypothetical protein A3C35_07090 [Omnitrophica bacterium RIFCSPHIGHO2_02_FULL_46_11]|nr:MAG: hypothetical protein A3C35_07090 [Omnitrophica bacterium RIFCSPHIGHO2_02_FULL_46_11]
MTHLLRRFLFYPALLLSGLILLIPPCWALAKTPPKEEAGSIKELPPTPSLSLRNCYELALKYSETVAIQKEEIEKAEAGFLLATSEALGDVDLIMTDLKQEAAKKSGSGSSSSSFENSLRAADRREVKFVVNQPLFQGFKSLGALTGAGGYRKQKKYEWLRAKELLFLDVTHAFYQFLQYKNELEIIKQMQKVLTDRFSDLDNREKIGRSRLSEVATAKAKMKTTDAEFARLNGAVEIAKSILEFLIATSFDPSQLDDQELKELPHDQIKLYLDHLEARSDVRAAKQAMHVARKNLIVAQSSLWPVISLEHNRYTRRDGSQSEINWDVLFKIDVPLFRGGGNLGKIKEAISNFKNAKRMYERTKREADLEVKESHQNWIASVNQFKALTESVFAAEENYRLQKDEYTHNLVNNLDVLDALELLYQARRDANRVYYEMKENYWRLRIASGSVHELI